MKLPPFPVGSTFGKLTVLRYGGVKTLCLCECGTEKEIYTGSLRSGQTRACGCMMKVHSAKELLTPAQVLERVPTVLVESLPPLISPNSARVVSYQCPGCSAVHSKRMYELLHHRKAANCDCHFVPTDELTKKRGKLLYVGDKSARLNRFGHTIVPFLCDCGKTTLRSVKSVFSDGSAVPCCGKCNERPPEWWNGRRFGSLVVSGVESPLHLRSSKRVTVTCVCGYSYSRSAGTLKPTCKCPMCSESAKRWWADKPPITTHRGVCSLEYLQEFFKGHTLLPLEKCSSQRTPSRFRCLLCEREYTTTLFSVVRNQSYSCGCSFTRVSKPAIEIADFLRPLAASVEYEFKIGKWAYDIRADKLLVEYHGDRHHKGRVSKRDRVKKETAESAGFRYVIVMESEWKHCRELVRDRLVAFLRTGD